MVEENQTLDDENHLIKRTIWIRGLLVIVFLLLFGFAETILFFSAAIQFIWMLIRGKRNEHIAEFGTDLGNWLAAVARFQSGASEELPFPWEKWKQH
ncbi:DUF4389 domain-containing protein [Lentilitoribacter sp. Alg239-R112]|uniref:DUF4389 domain-containing protein n=1 Tax=Lentilitoribacter sp. Alg239-R112 TaxID=2305987 RepID=UPI0013A6ACD3|nr:DUF4389 domain-containing protein [Lentilitoribacter sp. Alg239-R112]